MRPSLTFDVVGVVDDKDPIPHHRQIHRQVADVIAFIGILKYGTTISRLAFVVLYLQLKQHTPVTSLKGNLSLNKTLNW